EVYLAGRVLHRQLVAQVEREATGIGPEEIGLTLEEGKTVLRQVQAGVVHRQVEALQAAHRKSLQYLYADWGSKVPYRRAATVLQELLPERVSHATLRRHTLKVGARLQQRVIEPSEYDWPESRREPVPAAKSVSVAIDGTYVRADGAMWLREYQVVAGRMERQGKLGDYFAWVPQHCLCFSKGYMKAALESNSWTPKSKVRVLADGADGMSNLVDDAVEKPTERVLDWFQIGMRMQPIEQMSSKIAIAVGDSALKQLLTEKVPRIRYQ